MQHDFLRVIYVPAMPTQTTVTGEVAMPMMEKAYQNV
jgi:hypothetical protein